MSRSGAIAFTPLLLGLAGCTHLDVVPLSSSSTFPVRGLTYNLPFEQFELTVTRTLTGCASAQQAIAWKTDVAVISNGAQPDAGQEFQIDLNNLSSAWKTSDLKITMKGSLLTQLNATATDQTAQVIQNVASTAESIASAVATGGLGFMKDNNPLPQCSAGALAALAALGDPDHDPAALNAKLKVAAAKLTVDTATLKALSPATVGLGSSIDPHIQGAVFDAAKLVAADSAAVQVLQDQVTAQQSQITVSKTFRWPPSGMLDANAPEPYQQIVLPGGADAMSKWTGSTGSGPAGFFVISLRLQRLPGSELVPVVPSTNVATKPKDVSAMGLRYRTSVRAQLLVCSSPAGEKSELVEAANGIAPCGSVEAAGAYLPASTKSLWEGSAPQLGRVQFLPYKNGAFQSNMLAATFNDDGTLATAEYQELTSRAASISSALLQATQAGTSAAKAVGTAPTTVLTAEANQLQAQAAVINGKAALTTAQQTALAQANTSLAQALKAQADAQAALTASNPSK